MEGRSYSDQAMALSELKERVSERFVVHLMMPHELEKYLKGEPLYVLSGFVRRPDNARLVGIYQEDVAHTVYGNEKPTHAEYRVVWERQSFVEESARTVR